jgi:predicted dienelactone hydrolase
MPEQARLTVLIDPAKKRAFEKLCAEQDLNASQVLRRLIGELLQKHEALPASHRRPSR